MSNTYISVSQLNRYAKSLLSEDPKLRGVYIKGEISNFNRNYRSGHCYFSLKDTDASIKAVMFKGIADRIKFDIEDGLAVVVRADVTIYERDGSFQLSVSDMIPYGMGEMGIAFEQLKQKLSEKGLFDPHSKKPIPQFPKKIAVISSKTGAALQDILNILGRRMPYTEVLLYPVAVQGSNVVKDVITAINHIQTVNVADEIIIARGGGSSEDLHQFNSEELAYAIYNCSIPIISAIGHETDFTICDFVADLRAPTPSAAAELAGIPVQEIAEGVKYYRDRARITVEKLVSANKRAVKSIYLPRISTAMFAKVEKNRQQSDFLIKYSGKAIRAKMTALSSRFAQNCARLEAVNPFSVLKRGYAIVSDDNGNQLVSTSSAKVGQTVEIKLKDGSIDAKIIGVNY